MHAYARMYAYKNSTLLKITLMYNLNLQNHSSSKQQTSTKIASAWKYGAPSRINTESPFHALTHFFNCFHLEWWKLLYVRRNHVRFPDQSVRGNEPLLLFGENHQKPQFQRRKSPGANEEYQSCLLLQASSAMTNQISGTNAVRYVQALSPSPVRTYGTARATCLIWHRTLSCLRSSKIYFLRTVLRRKAFQWRFAYHTTKVLAHMPPTKSLHRVSSKHKIWSLRKPKVTTAKRATTPRYHENKSRELLRLNIQFPTFGNPYRAKIYPTKKKHLVNRRRLSDSKLPRRKSRAEDQKRLKVPQNSRRNMSWKLA